MTYNLLIALNPQYALENLLRNETTSNQEVN